MAFHGVREDLDLIVSEHSPTNQLPEETRSLAEIHPDLIRSELPSAERRQALARKVDFDLSTQLVPAMWLGFLMSLAFIVLPLAGQTAASVYLHERGDRRFQCLLSYLELTAAASLLAILPPAALFIGLMRTNSSLVMLGSLVGLMLTPFVCWLAWDSTQGWRRRMWLAIGGCGSLAFGWGMLNPLGEDVAIFAAGLVVLTLAGLIGVLNRWRWPVRFGMYALVLFALVTALLAY
jgi:hypothetical protein